MTSMPASRRARAMIFAPRSWPSRPGFATRTRIGGLLVIEERVYLAGGRVGYPPPPWGYLAGKYFGFCQLQRVSVCKIFILNGLCLKYLKSAVYLHSAYRKKG